MKRSTTIPVPGSPALAQDLAATAAETELSQADVIRQSLKLGMPALRDRLGKKPRRRTTRNSAIAAIARAWSLTVVTRDVNQFPFVETLNPFT